MTVATRTRSPASQTRHGSRCDREQRNPESRPLSSKRMRETARFFMTSQPSSIGKKQGLEKQKENDDNYVYATS
jgi:hypothetical protein